MPLPAPPDPPKDQAERERVMFDAWLTECKTRWEDAVVECVLAQLPSLIEPKTAHPHGS